MPSLNKDELNEIINLSPFKNDTFKTFVETGTYRGDTIFAMEPFFDALHTIEIKKEFHEKCKEKYEGKKINFHLGDSSNILLEILPTIQGDAIFFLDGHWSSKDTGRGPKDVPLFEELASIEQLLSGSALLIIDDFRLFGRHPKAFFKFKYHAEDWSAVSRRSLIACVKPRLISHFVHGDRFSICIREREKKVS